MGISIEGVKGYEYQYKVTLLIALILNNDHFKLFIEKAGSEDALLIFERNGITETIEIQVKGERNTINTSKLVDWLSHFQEYKHDNNLLQKLIQKQNISALFITRSRCSDDTVILKTSLENVINKTSKNISLKFFNEFKNVLKNKKFGKSQLMKERELFCKTQANNLKKKLQLNSILEKCLIIEELTDEIIDTKITSLLNSKYTIALSRTNHIYFKLLDIIRDGRDSGNNISQKLKECLSTNKIGAPLIDQNYKTRDEEIALINDLQKEGTLLLTGSSQCGKTELAKTISNHFVSQGYDYQIFDNIPEIKRFLNSNKADHKITILEDPFGHSELVNNYSTILRNLKSLILNKEKHHFFIVSSRIEIVLELFNTHCISNCKIFNFHWYDLTIKNNTIVNSFWSLISNEHNIPVHIQKIVSDGISKSNSENLLQIGHLTYLAYEETDNLNNKDFNSLQHIARSDSIEIARTLKTYNKNSADILACISMCSNSVNKLLLSDLAYILSEFNEFPSTLNMDVFLTNSNENYPPQFPIYNPEIKISQYDQDSLDYLEEKGFITNFSDSIIITHPNYYEAGRYLFFEKVKSRQKKKLKTLKRCLTTLSTSTSYHTSKNFNFIYNEIDNQFRNEIIGIAFTGLNSIFPSVRDNSIIFLTNHIQRIQEINKEDYKHLIFQTQKGDIDDSNLYWHNDIPFISNEQRIGLDYLFLDIDDNLIQRVKKLLSNGLLPNIQEAWKYLIFLERQEHISLDELNILFQVNEAFMRIKVVYLFFKEPKMLTKKIIKELFDDEHPNVIFSIIRASLINWFHFSKPIKFQIFRLIYKSINKKSVAIRAYSLLCNFATDYSNESVYDNNLNEEQKKEIWKIWGIIFPICLNSVSLGVIMNTSRFTRTMIESIKYLEPKVGINVLKSRYNNITYRIKQGLFIDEDEMSITHDLLKLTEKNHIIRKELFSKIITYNDTSFLLTNLKWIFHFWTCLHLSEKKQISELLNSKREDLRWIKAATLTSHTPPKELIKTLLEIQELNPLNIKDIYHQFSKQLLRDCLHLYCGSPQYLSSLSLDHNNKYFWEALIRFILKDENNIGFDICLQEFLKNCINGNNYVWDDWDSIWKEICLSCNNKQLLAKSLLHNTAKISCNLKYTKKLWSILIDSYESIDSIDKIIEYIALNIELIQQTGQKGDILKIFEKEFLLKVVCLLDLDHEVIRLIEKPKSEQDEYIKVLKFNLNSGNLRFHQTFTYIEKRIASNKVSIETARILKAIPNRINKIGLSQLNQLTSLENYKLDNWIKAN